MTARKILRVTFGVLLAVHVLPISFAIISLGMERPGEWKNGLLGGYLIDLVLLLIFAFTFALKWAFKSEPTNNEEL